MKGILIPIVIIISLMGCAAALDVKNGVELRPGEAVQSWNRSAVGRWQSAVFGFI
jgi:hypothetical protein